MLQLPIFGSNLVVVCFEGERFYSDFDFHPAELVVLEEVHSELLDSLEYQLYVLHK